MPVPINIVSDEHYMQFIFVQALYTFSNNAESDTFTTAIEKSPIYSGTCNYAPNVKVIPSYKILP